MKLCFLGAGESGKTCLLAALFAATRHNVSADFGLIPASVVTEGKLNAIADQLLNTPMGFPIGTIEDASYELRFVHRLRDKSGKVIRTIPYDLTLTDFRGASLFGTPDADHKSVLERTKTLLLSQDAYIILINSEILKEDNKYIIENRLALGVIREMMDYLVDNRYRNDDIIPAAFVLTKADTIAYEQATKVTDNFRSIVVEPFQRAYGDSVLSMFSRSSIVRETTEKSEEFWPVGVVAPFLFTAGGTIMRRGMKSRVESLSALTQASAYGEQRSRLAKQNWFVRLGSYIDGNGLAALERKELERRVYFTAQKNMSDTDQQVAESVFRLLDSLKDEEACRIFHGTKEIAASTVAEALRL